MTNYEIADQFSLLSKLMDIHGEDSFKAKSYASAAFNIEKLPVELERLDDAELFNQKGIGKSLGAKIREILSTGKMTALENILAITPAGILEMMTIKGLGPKKIAIIWKELGIETLGELEYACNENRIAQAKGFGAKTQENILQSIAYYKQNLGFHLWAEVEDTANAILQQLQKSFPGNKFSFTGDFRRQVETLEFIEIVSDVEKDQLIASFLSIEGVKIDEQAEHYLLIHIPSQPRLKFYLVETDAFYETLFTTTGSNEFLIAFLEDYKIPDQAQSEEVIFEANQLSVIPPAQRETKGVLSKAAQHALADVIQAKDIKAIIHSHSTWSDGVDTIEKMAKTAIDKGFEYMVISDHSQVAFYAQGLSPERIAAQHQEVDALNAKLAPFKIFKSIEVDILNDGSLDYTPKVLNTLDLVIASVHSNLKMSQEKAMDRVLAAVRNPFTTILGHPTGRLLLSRKGYPLDHKVLIDTCAEHNVVIEINAHPRRLDINWRWMEYAIEKGVLLSIDPDAHAIAGYHDVYYGVMVAQKAGVTAKNNLSSYTLAEFEAFLEKYRAKKSKVLI